jgi:hypothetical protein
MTGAMVDVLFLLTMTKVFDDGDETVKKYELAVRCRWSGRRKSSRPSLGKSAV